MRVWGWGGGELGGCGVGGGENWVGVRVWSWGGCDGASKSLVSDENSVVKKTIHHLVLAYYT